MNDPFRLIGVEPSQDTTEALIKMAADAGRGELIGIAYVAMYRGREYYIGFTGECARNTTWTRGMVADLHDELKQK